VEEEEEMMEEDTAVEEGIKDADFEMARRNLKTLRRLLAHSQQQQDVIDSFFFTRLPTSIHS
jgi:hypothetical protein